MISQSSGELSCLAKGLVPQIIPHWNGLPPAVVAAETVEEFNSLI